jgi:hypothetical protein
MTILDFISPDSSKLSEADKNYILYLYLEKDMTAPAIASLIDRHTTTVRRFLVKSGVFVSGKNVVSTLHLKPKTFGSGLVIRFSTYSTPDFLDYIGLPPMPELAYRWNINF